MYYKFYKFYGMDNYITKKSGKSSINENKKLTLQYKINKGYMKKQGINILLAIAVVFCGCRAMASDAETDTANEDGSIVYFTDDISPEGLIKVYTALGVRPEGRVAVKISTGESQESNMLSPDLIEGLVKMVNGTLVECNTAYSGNRMKTEDHLKAIAERGYDKIAPVDIMDSEGYIDIPVQDTTHIPYDRVGSHISNYDFMINLAHFKGHQMGGFGGVLKNASIGVASSEGKALIHTAGRTADTDEAFDNRKGQDAFLESMAAAAQGVHDYFKGKLVYINVMNNLSVDCDCNGHPSAPEMKDIGILASTDPVALDQACLDLVFNHEGGEGDDNTALIERIRTRHGTHIVDHAEKIGLGSRKYNLVKLQ